MATFGRLSDIIEKGERLDVNRALLFAIDRPQLKTLIIQLNTRGQLYVKGIDSQGRELSSIGGEYTAYTLNLKDPGRPRNVASHIDLFDTGNFYESFEVKAQADGFVIMADTIKEGEDLRVRWGDDILGLTEASREQLVQTVPLFVVEYVLNTLL